jgi:hypothetical protein
MCTADDEPVTSPARYHLRELLKRHGLTATGAS